MSMLMPIPAPAPASVIIDVWPGLAPGETDSSVGHPLDNPSDTEYLVTDVHRPQLHLYTLADGKSHPAVLVLPGGGYMELAADKEGAEIAKWLNGQGFAAAVLYYRVPNNRDGAFADAQHALALLHLDAANYGIDRSRIGVIGFSAGAHLAARLAAAEPQPSRGERDDLRPDFALLIYPAYLTPTHQGTPETAAEVKPHPGMPPTFLVQTEDDPYLDAPAYADELKAAGVKTELHVYATGGHGYGLRAPTSEPVHGWADAAAGWLGQLAK